MKDKTKTFLIMLSLIAFIVVGVLLVIKIGDIGKTQSAVNKQYKIQIIMQKIFFSAVQVMIYE